MGLLVQIQFREMEKKVYNTSLKKKERYLDLKKRIKSDNNYYLYLTSSTNNSIFTLVDTQGEVLLWLSCGSTFSGKSRASEVAHIETCTNFMGLASSAGVVNISIVFKGSNVWHNTIVRQISTFERNVVEVKKTKKKTKKKKNNLKGDKPLFKHKVIVKVVKFELFGLRDVTNIPFNGCRK